MTSMAEPQDRSARDVGSRAELTCALLGIPLDDWQRWAVRELEMRGLRFCIDFGYQNCVWMAMGLYPHCWFARDNGVRH